jgi:hypothetical protein
LRRAFSGALLLVALIVASFARSDAQTTPVPPSPAPSPTATPTPPWTVSGFADVTYTTPLAAGGTFVFTDGISNRVFDGITGNGTATPSMTRLVPNAFNVNIRKNTTQGLGGQLEVTIGSDANVINSYGYTPNTYTDVTQGFLYYATGPWTLDAGKFETLAGYEVIESPSDNNISRSILFGYAVPFTHTGVRLVYAPTSHFSATAGANFGWDQMRSTTGLGTIEGAIAWTPSPVFSLSGDVYSGKEPSALTPYPPTGGTIYGTRTLVDLVGHWNPNSKWNFGINYDSATQTNDQSFTSTGAVVPGLGTVNWNGVAGYALYNVNGNVTLAGRLEHFDDANGVRTGIAQAWYEGTATLQYVPTATNWKFRAEYRYDWSNVASFARYTSPVGTSATNNSSLGAEVIYTFP